MKIILGPSDLRPEYWIQNEDNGIIGQRILTGEIMLDNFQEDVQDIVRVVGMALYEPLDENNSKIIKAPKRNFLAR